MKKDPCPIKVLWFDLGNVVLFFDFKKAYELLSRFTRFPPRFIARHFRSRPHLEAALDEGRLRGRAIFRFFVRELGLSNLSYPRFKAIWNDIFWENPPVIRLVRRLKKKGYRLILISNTHALHWDYVRRKFPVVQCFHHRVLSFRVGARKPKRRIFQEALRVSRAKPREILYIDDRGDLTRQALFHHGIHTHTYRSVGHLKRVLHRLKILEG